MSEQRRWGRERTQVETRAYRAEQERRVMTPTPDLRRLAERVRTLRRSVTVSAALVEALADLREMATDDTILDLYARLDAAEANAADAQRLREAAEVALPREEARWTKATREQYDRIAALTARLLALLDAAPKNCECAACKNARALLEEEMR